MLSVIKLYVVMLASNRLVVFFSAEPMSFESFLCFHRRVDFEKCALLKVRRGYHGSLTEEGKLSRVDLLVKWKKCIYNEKYVWTDEEIFL